MTELSQKNPHILNPAAKLTLAQLAKTQKQKKFPRLQITNGASGLPTMLTDQLISTPASAENPKQLPTILTKALSQLTQLIQIKAL